MLLNAHFVDDPKMLNGESGLLRDNKAPRLRNCQL
jgi:hypothetical protein